MRRFLRSVITVCKTALKLVRDAAHFARSLLRHRKTIAAENIVLRKQLAMYIERGKKPRRAEDAERIAMVVLDKLFDIRDALVIVKPRTLKEWAKRLQRGWWRWISRPKGRPPLPDDIQQIIVRMSGENPQWSYRKIARELRKLGIQIANNTVKRYLPISDPRSRGKVPRRDQRWSTFVSNHAQQMVACDFLRETTIAFKDVYALVVTHLGSRRILHTNVTEHPTAEWTAQQLREALPGDHGIKYLIHDRDTKFSEMVDTALQSIGVIALKTPPRAPQANAFCERLIGTIRRECLDWIITLSPSHLARTLRNFTEYYNTARPHMSLGRSVPEPSEGVPAPLTESCFSS